MNTNVPAQSAPTTEASRPDDEALTPQQTAFLLQLLTSNDPLHLHFEAPLWTPQAIAEVVRDEFDKALAPEALNRCLFELGLLPGDPLLSREPADRTRYSHWINTELPLRIKAGQTLWWICECRLSIEDDDLSRGAHAAIRPRTATVITAVDGAGQLAWWFCRSVASTEVRAEFVSRLQRLSPLCAVLACGLEECYLEAAARLPLALQAPLILDPRQAMDPAPAGAVAGLFRQEVYAARQRRIDGEILVVQPLPVRLMTIATLVLLVTLALLGTFGHYARTQTAIGVLLPATGVVRLQSPQAGVLQMLNAAVGDRVSAGQSLAHIVSAQVDIDGAAVNAHIVEELERSMAAMDREESSIQRQGELEHQRYVDAVASATRQLDGLTQQYSLQQQRQRLLDDNLARSRKLATAGVIAKVQLQEIEQQALSSKEQALAVARDRSNAATAISEARNRLAQQPLDLEQRIEVLGQRRRETAQRLAAAKLNAGATLSAPSAGRVAAVLAQAGSHVAANAPLLVLVDDRVPLRAELFVPSRAIGFIRRGQNVQLQLDAFPYQQYGYQHGTVSEISSAAVNSRDLDVPVPLNEPVYLVRVALDTQHIEAFGEQRALSAGMQIQADIVIDRPRIIDWVLQPLFALRGH